ESRADVGDADRLEVGDPLLRKGRPRSLVQTLAVAEDVGPPRRVAVEGAVEDLEAQLSGAGAVPLRAANADFVLLRRGSGGSGFLPAASNALAGTTHDAVSRKISRPFLIPHAGTGCMEELPNQGAAGRRPGTGGRKTPFACILPPCSLSPPAR